MTEKAASTVAVMADAQFSAATVLRPFTGFEAVYQGQNVDVPIAFPGTLDPSVGKIPGTSPYLLAGTSVPYGAKMTLFFPMITTTQGGTVYDYTYLLHWRLRNMADYPIRRAAYRITKDEYGAPDTLLQPGPRLIIPAGVETVAFQEAEPTGVGAATVNLRAEQIRIPDDGTASLSTAGLPLLPPGSAPAFQNGFPGVATTPLGAFQQGILDPAASVLAPYSIFRPYFTIAKGDDLIITVIRSNFGTAPSPNVWDFGAGGPDAEFSNIFGRNVGGPTHPEFKEAGIYLFTGTNPS